MRGACDYESSALLSSSRVSLQAHELYNMGFRVVSVHQPGSLVMLAAGIALTPMLYYWRMQA
jgi:hypothetical protein